MVIRGGQSEKGFSLMATPLLHEAPLFMGEVRVELDIFILSFSGLLGSNYRVWLFRGSIPTF